MCEKAQEELMALAEKYQDQQKEVIEIQEKLQVNTRTCSDRVDIRLAGRGHSNPGEKLKKVLNYI